MRRPSPGSALTACLLLGCAIQRSGAGTGTVEPTGERARFSWTSSDGGQTGTMTAVVRDRAFSGPFFQIRQDVQQEALGPLWPGWSHGWYDWRYWGTFPAEQFTTVYSGKVVANLSSPDGGRLRCRFHLMNPAAGMAGGGQGECQVAGD